MVNFNVLYTCGNTGLSSFLGLTLLRGIKTMSEQFEKINSKDLLYVITSRGAIDAKKGCAIL